MIRIFRYLAPYKWRVLLLSVLYMITSACMLLLPYTMSDIINIGIANGDMPYIWQRCGIMLAIAAVAVVCNVTAVSVVRSVRTAFCRSMRTTVVNKVISLKADQFSTIGTAGLFTRTTEDLGWIEQVLAQMPYFLTITPVLFVGGVVLTAIKNWQLALILLCVTPIVLLLVWLTIKDMHARWQSANKLTDTQNRSIRERVSGIRVIRAFDKDKVEHSRTERATYYMSRAYIANNTRSGLIEPLVSTILNFAVIVIMYLSALDINNGGTTQAGDVAAIIQYVALMSSSMLMMSHFMAMMPHMLTNLDRIQEILDMPVLEEPEYENLTLGGDIELYDVSFAYPGSVSDSLSHVNMSIKQGEVVGIIGGTGSGKSTLTKLLLSLFQEYRGTIKLGGREYHTMSGKDVRNNVAVTLQKGLVFESSIRDNILMGNSDASAELVDKAVGISQLKDFVNSNADGLEYKLSQGGTNISGGQKQRVNIARTLVKQANVYIFDDSFSALDYLTEAKLRKALNIYLDGKTQIIITQRVSTAMRCDKVYVLDEGKVVGEGKHKHLVKNCAIYNEICQSQLGKDMLD